MPEMWQCCVQQPTQCKAFIVFDGAIYNWQQVEVPGWGLLCFCPYHDEAAKHAKEISDEHYHRISERNARYDAFLAQHGIRLP